MVTMSRIVYRRFQATAVCGIRIAILLCLFLIPRVAYSQQDSGAPSTEEDSSVRLPVQVTTTNMPVVTNSDTGQSLLNPLSSLHLGRLSLLSFESFYLFDNNYNLSVNDPHSSQAGTVRGHLVYSIRRKQVEFTLQYRPYLVASDGHIQGDYASHNLDLNSYIRLAPRWALHLTENFHFAQDRGQRAEFGLMPDYLTGNVTKNPYLATGLKYFENDFGSSLEHPLNARNSTEIDFRYQYIRDLNDVQTASDITATPSFVSLQSMQSFELGLGWSHSFSAAQGLQLRYGYENRLYGQGGTTQLHNLIVSYNLRIRRSLFMRLSAGPAFLVRSQPSGAVSGAPSTKSYEGEAAVTKSFRKASVTVSAARNQDFTGLIGDAFNDRYDFSAARRLSQRWSVQAGTGYVRQGFSTGSGVNGQQIWGRIDYRFSREWSGFTSFTSLQQTGGLHLGRRNLIMGGVRWSWRPPNGENSGV